MNSNDNNYTHPYQQEDISIKYDKQINDSENQIIHVRSPQGQARRRNEQYSRTTKRPDADD